MTQQGKLLASGRDADIFDWGPGRVLRRARDARSLEAEAEVMRRVATTGYPMPQVYDVVDGDIVMERIDGPTMLDDVTHHPWRLRRYAVLLADLHTRLGELRATDELPEAPVPGDRVVHLDLHPLNVLMTADGPKVIDWANTRRGDPAVESST